jgi:uncharacterized protein
MKGRDGVVAAVALVLGLGVTPISAANAAPTTDSVEIATAPVTPEYAADYINFVLNDLLTFWDDWFKRNSFGKEPDIIMAVMKPGDGNFTTQCLNSDGVIPTVNTDSPGPFYCPNDVQVQPDGRLVVGEVFLPVRSMTQMWNGNIVGNPSKQAGDFAAAIATAHEFGHHVADELRLNWLISPPPGKYKELLADCLAGVWTAHVYYEGLLEPGDFEEGVAALEAVGDKGMSNDPHGSPAERSQAMRDGYNGIAGVGGPMDPFVCTKTYWR